MAQRMPGFSTMLLISETGNLNLSRSEPCHKTGGILQIFLDKADGPLLAEIKIPDSTEWNTVITRKLKFQNGIHNLVVLLKDNNPVEVDWVKFKN